MVITGANMEIHMQEADLGEGHQPGDIEDLSRRVKDAAMEEIDRCRIRPEDLSARCIAVLNDLPVTSAVEVRIDDQPLAYISSM